MFRFLSRSDRAAIIEDVVGALALTVLVIATLHLPLFA
jgi:hypothetical protein